MACAKNIKIENNDTFTKCDLRIGYTVKLRNGEFRIVMPVNDGTLILYGGPGKWEYLSSWNTALYYKEFDLITRTPMFDEKYDIMEVYGFVKGTENYDRVGDLDACHKPLLWSRVEARKMTVSEISKELGYPVEIVAEV